MKQIGEVEFRLYRLEGLVKRMLLHCTIDRPMTDEESTNIFRNAKKEVQEMINEDFDTKKIFPRKENGD